MNILNALIRQYIHYTKCNEYIVVLTRWGEMLHSALSFAMKTAVLWFEFHESYDSEQFPRVSIDK